MVTWITSEINVRGLGNNLRVNGDVQPKKFDKRRIITKTKKGRQVIRVIFRGIDNR